MENYCPRCAATLCQKVQQSAESFYSAVPGGQAIFGHRQILTLSWDECLRCGFIEVADFQPVEPAVSKIDLN